MAARVVCKQGVLSPLWGITRGGGGGRYDGRSGTRWDWERVEWHGIENSLNYTKLKLGYVLVWATKLNYSTQTYVRRG